MKEEEITIEDTQPEYCECVVPYEETFAQCHKCNKPIRQPI